MGNFFNDIVIFFNKYNSIIAFIALIFSIYSIYISKKAERFEILISNSKYEGFHHLYRYNFDVINNSNKSITIESITFNNMSNTQLNPINFDIQDFYKKQRDAQLEQYRIKHEKEKQKHTFNFFGKEVISPSFSLHEDMMPINLLINNNNFISDYEYSSNLEDILITPYSKENITVYFDFNLDTLNITIQSDKIINRLSKSRTFPVHFNKFD